MPTILIISPELWNGHFVSKHHYAITLAKLGNNVYFLNPPEDNIKTTIVKKTSYDNVWEVSSPPIVKGLRFFPKFMRIKLEKKWLSNFENIIEKKITTVWLFENSRFYDMEFAENRLKIYHQVDLNQNFHVQEASSSADICFGTTDFIISKIKNYNANSYKIHHGYNESALLIKNNIYVDKVEKSFSNKINAIYIGNMNIKYLDFDLLNTLVSRYQNINFHFIGGYFDHNELFQKTKNFKNVIWWGKVDSSNLVNFLENADICLLAYKVSQYKEQLASPHKIMEYLSSGKVTVATYTDEYKDKRYLLEMVDDSKEYISKFEKVVNNLDFYNSKDKQKKRIAFAKEHSYDNQLQKISDLIQKHTSKRLKI